MTPITIEMDDGTIYLRGLGLHVEINIAEPATRYNPDGPGILAAEALADEFPCNFVTTLQVVALVGAARAREVLTEAYATNVHPVTVANRVAAKRAP